MMDSGNLGCGLLVNQSLKSALTPSFKLFSQIYSSLGNHETDKSQFYKRAHVPFAVAVLIIA